MQADGSDERSDPGDAGAEAAEDALVATAHPLSMRVAAKLAVFVLVCAILHLAEAILVPVALAALLTFVFAPVVKALQSAARLPRAAAIVVALAAATLVLGASSWLAYRQIAELAAELPEHRLNILRKVTDIRAFGRGGTLEKVSDTIKSINEEVEKIEDQEAREDPERQGDVPEAEPVPVEA